MIGAETSTKLQRKRIGTIIEDIPTDIQGFDRVEVSHCFREANITVDFLAKFRFSCDTHLI